MPRARSGFLPVASAADAAAADLALTDVQYGRSVVLPVPRATVVVPYTRITAYTDDYYGSPVDVVWVNWAEPTHATLLLRASVDVGNPSLIYVHVRFSLGGSSRF